MGESRVERKGQNFFKNEMGRGRGVFFFEIGNYSFN